MVEQYNGIGRRDFMKLEVKVGLASLVGFSCSKKEPVRSDVSDSDSIDKETVDANEHTIPFSDIKKVRARKGIGEEVLGYDGELPAEALPGKDFWVSVRYHGITKDGKNFTLSSDANSPIISFVALKGGMEELDDIKPPLRPKIEFHDYAVDANQIDFLGKPYQVFHLNPISVTLRRMDR